MKKLILSSIATFFLIAFAFGKSTQIKSNERQSEATALKGSKFQLKFQAFAVNDENGVAKDTVSNEGDYILFGDNGMAYMNYKGTLDSIAYEFVGKNAVSFGDTPFIIKKIGNGYFSLYQNEEEKNGYYNRVTYLLKEEKEQQISYSK